MIHAAANVSSCNSDALLKQREVIDRLNALNIEFRENTPEEFRAFVAAETEKWSRVIREANIKLG